MSTLSSANVTDVNLVLKERTHMRLCINMLIFTHNLGNRLISQLPKLCVKITIFMQGHVLIADWSVAYFVVIMNDVIDGKEASGGKFKD